MKPQAWAMIANELNTRFPGYDRTAHEARKKWQNMCTSGSSSHVLFSQLACNQTLPFQVARRCS